MIALAAGTNAPSDLAEREAWTILSTAEGVGPATFARLLRRHGDARTVLDVAMRPAGVADLVAAGLLADEPFEQTDDEIRRPRNVRLDGDVAADIARAALDGPRILKRMRLLGVEVMTLDDGDYPLRLLALDHPPPVLFVRGARDVLSAEHPVAVVGTRHPTEAGRRLAAEIATAISSAGGVVVSGLALGIDGAAHGGALDAKRPTIAVLGSGHGRLYPRAHAPLADHIVAEGGCVISELGPDTAGTRGTFPQRNRVISGLADAVVVVEAPRRSGALSTADWALLQGRELFLVPGPIGAPASEGCLVFLRSYHGQARIVASVHTLIEDLGFEVEVRPGARPSMMDLGETETRIASLVLAGHASVDALVAVTSFPVSTVLSCLTLLEMRGLVAGAYGRYRPYGLLLPKVEPKRRRRDP